MARQILAACGWVYAVNPDGSLRWRLPADAEVKAEKILNRAHSRLSQLHEDIAELKRQRVQIELG